MSAVIEQVVEQIEPAAPEVPFVPGVRTDLEHDDYLRVDALSASGIKLLLRSPLHYKMDRETPREATPAMQIGTAVHMAILEPERYVSDVAIIPADAPRRPTAAQQNAARPSPATVAAMQWWAAFETEHAGKLMLSAADGERVGKMAASVRRHPIHAAMMEEGGDSEVSMFWRDARHDIACKARFDRLAGGFAYDVKSCQDASPDGFARAVAAFRYHLQAAWYSNGYEHVANESLRAFVFVAVESEAPHACAAYVLEPNAILFGHDQNERAMLLYAQAKKSGYWRGYSERVNPIILPRWATSIATPTY